MTAVWAQALLTLALALIFLGFLVWGIRSGQFRDVEEPKFRMLEGPEDHGKNGEESSGKDHP